MRPCDWNHGQPPRWLTSLEASRRAQYSWLFYPVHHLGFWAFFLAGVMHYSPMIWYFVPGMLLYAVDGVYRLTQATLDGGAARVVAAGVPQDGRVRAASRLCGPGGRNA